MHLWVRNGICSDDNQNKINRKVVQGGESHQ